MLFLLLFLELLFVLTERWSSAESQQQQVSSSSHKGNRKGHLTRNTGIVVIQLTEYHVEIPNTSKADISHIIRFSCK